MTRVEPRLLFPSVGILAVALIALPWAGGGRAPAGQVGLVLSLALAGAAGIVAFAPTGRRRLTLWLAPAVTLVGASAVQTLHADRTIQTLLHLLAYGLAGWLTARGVRAVPGVGRVLLAACLASGLLVTGDGIVRLLQGNSGGMYATVLIGPFGYPNAMAGFLLLMAGVSAATLQPDRNPGERGMALAGCILFPLGILLTRSRGGILAAAIGLLIWAVLERERWRSRRWLWGTAAALGLAGTLGSMGGRLIGALSALWSDGAGDTSVQWRLAIFRSTWTMIREHPWLGVGPGAFPVAMTHVQALPYVGGENPHNLFLEIAAEYGLPAGMLAVLGLIVCLTRAGMAARRLPAARPTRARLAALVASLGAFAVHNGMDLDWSFPACALVGATLLGHLVSGMPSAPASRSPLMRGRVWRGAILLVLATAAIVAGTRYTASILVERGRAALATGNTTDAGRQFERAERFNPLSFSAHYWLAWTRLRAGDPPGALRAAEAARSSAPQDPNTDALVGEMALAGRRWELAQAAFQRSVERAPAAHLAFHAGLLEATAALDRRSDAIHAYERAVSLFAPERVLADESRCLAPGDRYLLARMSRIAGRLYDAGRDPRGAQAFNRAALLAQPDSRGICVTGRYPGRTSPEAAIENFWRTWHAEGWSRAQQYLLPASRPPEPEGGSRRIRVSWIHGLTGGELLATVRYEVELEDGNSRTTRCAQSTTRLTSEGWMLDGLPLIGKAPCWP